MGPDYLRYAAGSIHPRVNPWNSAMVIEYKRLTLGYFYKRIGFDENSENPEIDFNRYGAVIGFKF